MTMPVALYQPIPKRVKELAAKIKQGGLSYSRDGRDIMRILDILGQQWLDELGGQKGAGLAQFVRAQLLESLLKLEDTYGWDNPHQTEQQEDTVLGMFLAIWMLSNGIEKRFALEHVKADRLGHP